MEGGPPASATTLPPGLQASAPDGTAWDAGSSNRWWDLVGIVRSGSEKDESEIERCTTFIDWFRKA